MDTAAASFANEAWDAVRPALLILTIGLAPVLATWLTAKVVALLKVQKDSELALSLGRTIDNTLAALIQTKGVAAAQAVSGAPGALIAEAIPIIRRDNPAGVAVHAPTDDQLTTKILAKLPAAAATIAEANAALRPQAD